MFVWPSRHIRASGREISRLSLLFWQSAFTETHDMPNPGRPHLLVLLQVPHDLQFHGPQVQNYVLVNLTKVSADGSCSVHSNYIRTKFSNNSEWTIPDPTAGMQVKCTTFSPPNSPLPLTATEVIDKFAPIICRFYSDFVDARSHAQALMVIKRNKMAHWVNYRCIKPSVF